MAFSLEIHVAFSDGIYFEDFMEEQAMKRRVFIYKACIEFISEIRHYFSCDHSLTELQMSEIRAEVSISLIS